MKRNCKAKFFALLNSSICHDVRQRIDLSLLRRCLRLAQRHLSEKRRFLAAFSPLKSGGVPTPLGVGCFRQSQSVRIIPLFLLKIYKEKPSRFFFERRSREDCLANLLGFAFYPNVLRRAIARNKFNRAINKDILPSITDRENFIKLVNDRSKFMLMDEDYRLQDDDIKKFICEALGSEHANMIEKTPF